MSYDPDNIFARILRGEIPCHKVYEDEHTLAFMDIMPQSDGHTLVVPKAEAENIFDIPAEALAAAARTTQRIARAAGKADRQVYRKGKQSLLIDNLFRTAQLRINFARQAVS